jgi:hypothetical protein
MASFLEGGEKTVRSFYFQTSSSRRRNIHIFSNQVVRMVTYGIDLDQFDAVEQFTKDMAPKIRSQPGVKRCEFSVCGTGRLGAYYEFSSLQAFKDYSGAPFLEELKESMTSQSWYDSSKEPTEFVGVHQVNI